MRTFLSHKIRMLGNVQHSFHIPHIFAIPTHQPRHLSALAACVSNKKTYTVFFSTAVVEKFVHNVRKMRVSYARLNCSLKNSIIYQLNTIIGGQNFFLRV